MLPFVQNKYKEAGKKEVNRSLYSLLPHTMETQHAKEAAELLSEVTWCFLLLSSEKTVNIRDQNQDEVHSLFSHSCLDPAVL